MAIFAAFTENAEPVEKQMLSTVTRTVSLTLNLELMFSFIVEQNVRDELSGSIYFYIYFKKQEITRKLIGASKHEGSYTGTGINA